MEALGVICKVCTINGGTPQSLSDGSNSYASRREKHDIRKFVAVSHDIDDSLTHNMPQNDPPQADSPLIAWVKTHLGSLYHDEDSDFQTAFNSAFSQKASIHVDHEPISRDEFGMKMGRSRSALSRSSTIDWKEVLEIPQTSASDEGTTSAVGITQKSSFGSLVLNLPFE